MDSDDFIESDMVERMMEVMKKEQGDLVICSYRMDYRFAHLNRKAPRGQVWEKRAVLHELTKNEAINNFAWGKAVSCAPV